MLQPDKYNHLQHCIADELQQKVISTDLTIIQ